ncbi:MAG: hypothetical protein ACXVB9_10585 [Bdellovibrionota bacterium]
MNFKAAVFFALCASFTASGTAWADEPPSPKSPPTGVECAERILLLAAKKNVANQFHNSPTSGGLCAMGVRTSLQSSKVGGVTGSLGNAIDFLRSLKPHGFVDNGERDPKAAPAGSVLIFSGPNTPAYLHGGGYGKPAGNWLGHVTIKGDDGRYYTDGRTREPALGWTNGINVQKRRNMAGIYIPGDTLAKLYQGKCDGIAAEEQAVDLDLAASDLRLLPIEDPASREAGERLVNEGQEILARGDSPAVFQQALELARQSAPYDDEGEFVQALADRLQKNPAHRAELDQFMAAQTETRGVEACKTKVLVSSIQRSLCLGAAAQETSAACAKAVSWEECLALPAAL